MGDVFRISVNCLHNEGCTRRSPMMRGVVCLIAEWSLFEINVDLELEPCCACACRSQFMVLQNQKAAGHGYLCVFLTCLVSHIRLFQQFIFLLRLPTHHTHLSLFVNMHFTSLTVVLAALAAVNGAVLRRGPRVARPPVCGGDTVASCCQTDNTMNFIIFTNEYSTDC